MSNFRRDIKKHLTFFFQAELYPCSASLIFTSFCIAINWRENEANLVGQILIKPEKASLDKTQLVLTFLGQQ